MASCVLLVSVGCAVQNKPDPCEYLLAPHRRTHLVHLVERLALLNLLNHHVARAFLHHSIGPVRNGSNAHHGCRPGARVLGGVHPDVVQAAVVRRLRTRDDCEEDLIDEDPWQRMQFVRLVAFES